MRQIVVVGFPGLQSLDVTGPVEVFAAATDALRQRGFGDGYRLRFLTRDGEPLRSSSGLAMLPDGALEDVLAEGQRGVAEHLDTLLVVGGEGTQNALQDSALIDQIRALAASSRRVASVCSGAFLLAEAGLLNGRRATTHWSVCDQLARAYPGVTVEPDPIFVRDGEVWTSAGVTAGMDLALGMVEQDHGAELALTVARRLVLFLRRPAGQSQFSAHLAMQTADRAPLRELQAQIAAQPEGDWAVEVMAARAAMSPRHFARAFRAETGVTPARYVEQVRVEVARRRLEESGDAVERIATTCGFGSAETLRRVFHRQFGVSPAEYRRRFRVPVSV